MTKRNNPIISFMQTAGAVMIVAHHLPDSILRQVAHWWHPALSAIALPLFMFISGFLMKYMMWGG